MKLKMLIATKDRSYAEDVSNYISEKYGSLADVAVCNTSQDVKKMLTTRKFDVSLMDVEFSKEVTPNSIELPILLTKDEGVPDVPESSVFISKYQRISSIMSFILEQLSKVSKTAQSTFSHSANITAVWSPSGGVGKTTAALAYAKSISGSEREVFYLNLEPFSSVPTYFKEVGTSISSVFQMLDNHDGDVKMLIQGICNRESGITFLSSPNNYVDMNILSVENIRELVSVCSGLTEELVIDLSCECDSRTQQIFEIADKILIVTDSSESAEMKLFRFTQQNDVFDNIADKATLIVNKGAAVNSTIESLFGNAPVYLPLISVVDDTPVYKEISSYIGFGVKDD